MIKLNILNMTGFLDTVNACNNAVNIKSSDGHWENMNKQYNLQAELMKQYRRNQDCLPLTLHISDPKDYLRIVFYYTGEC